MTLLRTLAALVVLGATGMACAETDCNAPIAEWKSRELLRQQVEQRGWVVQRIKVDDGCYEVRGSDRMGNKIKAKYSPSSLRIRSLEVEFGPSADASDYVGPLQSKSIRGERVIPPFLTRAMSRDYAASASFCFGVMPPLAMLGRS